MKNALLALFALSVLLLSPSPVKAGVETDALTQCLLASTSTQDRQDLVRWVFSAASLHPAVSPIFSITAEQLDGANQGMGGLLERLMTVDCRDETIAAVKVEGELAIQTSFTILGQVAGQELFNSPEVAQALSGLDKHVDMQKIEALFAE